MRSIVFLVALLGFFNNVIAKPLEGTKQFSDDFFNESDLKGQPELQELIKQRPNPWEMRQAYGVKRQLKTFPCPDAADIAPCICYTDERDLLHLDCSLVPTEKYLETIFQQNFPVKHFQSFDLFDNSHITTLGDIFNGLTFVEVFVERCVNLREISQYWLADSRDTLVYLSIANTSLTSDAFPFISMDSYTRLEALFVPTNDFTFIPPIHSATIQGVAFESGMISVIEPDTFSNLPNLTYIGLSQNNLTSLAASTFVFSGVDHVLIYIYLYSNQLQHLEPGVFSVQGHPQNVTMRLHLENNKLRTVDEEVFRPIMPYLEFVQLFDNPLECGCDIVWLLLNPTYLDKVDPRAACSDGTLLTDLDLADYESFCSIPASH
ncbi:oplophorus-luciferin 2-monooxygenase non-catalytic subunit [Hyalella azteca]|uniref:Oplophorus-luciferin 2-monooxygenase non-catalytic subunit n=1 Tax=Hyalella azteca TaxID=294128 RepID=A0A8B7NSS9_HYAAZ|nr:oplophorus-luciferin 2-monooxygenase non-catalytic subunit [Hyalella azteca]